MNSNELFNSILNTLFVIGLCLALAIPVGIFLAIVLHRTNVAGRRWAWIALGSQLAVPLYVFAGGWSAGFGMQGWFTALGLQGGSPLGGSAWQTDWGSILAVALVHAFASIPWVTLITSLGLLWTHRSQEEQALLDGGWFNVLVKSLLPKLRLWIIAAALWCVVPIMTEMVVSNLYQVSTVAEQVYLDASRGSLSPLTYVAAVLICMLPIAFGMWTLLAFVPNWAAVIARSNHFRSSILSLEGWRIPMSMIVWSVVLLLVALPMFSLIAKAGWQPVVDGNGTTSYGWSLGRFITTVHESTTLFHAEFYWSGILALLSGTSALTFAGLLFAAGNRFILRLTTALMVLSITVPGPLVGMLIIWMLNRSSPAWLGTLYDTTLAAPVLAQQFRLLPVAWLLVHAAVGNISTSTWEQTQLDGLTRLDILKRVLLPQTGRLWIASLVLLMVLSIGELSCTILVLPPGVTTVSMRLFEMLHFGMRHQDSGLCGVLLIFGWGVSIVFWKTLSER